MCGSIGSYFGGLRMARRSGSLLPQTMMFSVSTSATRRCGRFLATSSFRKTRSMTAAVFFHPICGEDMLKLKAESDALADFLGAVAHDPSHPDGQGMATCLVSDTSSESFNKRF